MNRCKQHFNLISSNSLSFCFCFFFFLVYNDCKSCLLSLFLIELLNASYKTLVNYYALLCLHGTVLHIHTAFHNLQSVFLFIQSFNNYDGLP